MDKFSVPTQTVVTFLTQNMKLLHSLEAALPNIAVVRADNIEAVNNSVKHNNVRAVVLHIVNSAGWIIFELLRTGYPDVPRYAVLAPSASGSETEREMLAKRYGAALITNEKSGIKALASVIENDLIGRSSDSDGKERFLEIFGEMGRELTRLQTEYNMTAMRTLPNNHIARDTQKRLSTALSSIKAVKIAP